MKDSIFKDGSLTPPMYGNTYLIPVNSAKVMSDLEQKKANNNIPFDESAYDAVYDFSRDGTTAKQFNTVLGSLYDKTSNALAPYVDFIDYLKESIDGSKTPDNPLSPSSASKVNMPASAIEYVFADLAKHYGMSSETAYQEALSNTAYSRAVRDMQNAGLNPAVIFGAGRGSGSNGVSYISKDGSNSGGAFYANSNDEGSLFADRNFMSALGTLTFAILGKSPNTGEKIGKSVATVFDKVADIVK